MIYNDYFSIIAYYGIKDPGTPVRTPRWLQRERMDAFEGHSNALEVSLVCKEAEEIMCPQLHGGEGGYGSRGVDRGDGQGQGQGEVEGHDEDEGDVDDGAQTQEQYLQVRSIYPSIHLSFHNRCTYSTQHIS